MELVNRKPSFEIGQDSTRIFFCMTISISKRCLKREKACPIRQVPNNVASKRFWSVSSSSPRHSPAWKKNGRSTPSSTHRFRNQNNSGVRWARGRPKSSWPRKSNPETRSGNMGYYIGNIQQTREYVQNLSYVGVGKHSFYDRSSAENVGIYCIGHM